LFSLVKNIPKLEEDGEQ